MVGVVQLHVQQHGRKGLRLKCASGQVGVDIDAVQAGPGAGAGALEDLRGRCRSGSHAVDVGREVVGDIARQRIVAKQ